MRYKMSSYISSLFPCLRFLLPCTSFLPSFIYPSIIQGTLFFFSLLSLSPTHFSQNTFLSFILSPSASYSSHLSSSSLCLLDTSLGPFGIPPPCLYTLFSPSFPCDEWVCLLGAVHIYWAGERTLSVSLALHISIPPLKRQREQEVTVGWEEEGGQCKEIHFSSQHDSSWPGGDHVSMD